MQFDLKAAETLATLMLWRRDVRHFLPDPVPEEVLERQGGEEEERRKGGKRGDWGKGGEERRRGRGRKRRKRR